MFILQYIDCATAEATSGWPLDPGATQKLRKVGIIIRQGLTRLWWNLSEPSQAMTGPNNGLCGGYMFVRFMTKKTKTMPPSPSR